MAVLLFAFSAAAEPSSTHRVFNVRDFGAKGNGATMETRRIQNAIDACSKAGGGEVLFPAGRYTSGTLFLRNDVTLHLDRNAVLSASRDLDDYPRVIPKLRSTTETYTERSLIYGEGLRNVAIEGDGVLDGNGEAFFGPQIERPYLIRLVACRGVSVSGVTLRDAAMWAQHYLGCEDVAVKNITVRSYRHLNNDGLDLDGCQRVVISNCDIKSEDDSIVLKSTCDQPCRDVEISNCTLSSDNNALKLGTESSAGFEKISIHDCVIYNTKNSGVALEMVDGGRLEDVEVADLTMRDVGAPIFIRLGNRARPMVAGRPKPGVGSLRNVRIRNIVATDAGQIGCSITGLPSSPARNISLENIQITFRGGAGRNRLRETVAEKAANYPEHSMFGVLPAYGFYCRHVEDLSFSQISLDFQRADARPPLVCHDVKGLQLKEWNAKTASNKVKPFQFRDVVNARLDDKNI